MPSEIEIGAHFHSGNWSRAHLTLRPRGPFESWLRGNGDPSLWLSLFGLVEVPRPAELFTPGSPTSERTKLAWRLLRSLRDQDYQRVLTTADLLPSGDLDPCLTLLVSLCRARAMARLGETSHSERQYRLAEEKAGETGSLGLKALILFGRSEAAYLRQDWDDAGKMAMLAVKTLRQSDGSLRVHLSFYERLSAFRESPLRDRNTILMLFRIFRSQKNSLRVRELLVVRAIQTDDLELARCLYIGSPQEYVRNLLSEHFGRRLTARAMDFYWLPNGSPPVEENRLPRYLDVASGKTDGGLLVIKPGFLVHQMLLILSSDFYSRISLEDISRRLYPNLDEHSHSARLRVYQLVDRLREKFMAFDVPLTIKSDSAGYYLVTRSQFALRVSGSTLPMGLPQLRIDRAKRQMGEQDFTIEMFSEELGLSYHVGRRVLLEAMLSGEVEQLVRRRKKLFRFVPPPQNLI